MMLEEYEIMGANGLPYTVQLSPEAAEKLGAKPLNKGGKPEAKNAEKKVTRGKSANPANKSA